MQREVSIESPRHQRSEPTYADTWRTMMFGSTVQVTAHQNVPAEGVRAEDAPQAVEGGRATGMCDSHMDT